MENEILDENLYYYFDENGKKYHTSNSELAQVRAKFYGTDDVYIEKN
jgi:hypothetical protein